MTTEALCLRCLSNPRARSSSWCDACYLDHEVNPARRRQGLPPLSMEQLLEILKRPLKLPFSR